MKRGRKPNQKDFALIRLKDIVAIVGENCPLPINRKWLIQMHLLDEEVEPLTIPKVKTIQENKEDKITFSLQEN